MTRFLIPVFILLFVGATPEAVAEPTLLATPIAEKSKPSADGKNVYLKLPPITATIFRKDLPAGSFTVAVTLQIADERLRTDIIAVRRRLHDLMFRELHAMFEREEYTGRKVDVDAVKRRMLVVSRRELGDDVVVDVFVKTLIRKGA